MDKLDIQGALDILLATEINCDNGSRRSSAHDLVVKMQIQEAIVKLGGEPLTPRILESIKARGEAVFRGE